MKYLTKLLILLTLVAATVIFIYASHKYGFLTFKRRQNSDYYSTTSVRQSDLTLSERGLYEYDNKPFIWIFWEGKKRPSYVDLCLETVSCHNFRDFNVKVLNNSEFIKSVGTVHPAFPFLEIHHQSDYFRAKMLNTFGGIYLDIDTIGMQSYKHLVEKLPVYDVVGATSRGNADILHVGDLGPMKAGTRMTEKWMEGLNLVLDLKLKNLKQFSEGKLKEYPIQWGELVTRVKPILQRLVDEKKIKYYKIDGPSTWTQFNVNDMMGTGNNITSKLNDTPILSLNNALYPTHFKEMEKEDLIKSNIGISELIKYSLKQCGRSVL